MKPPLVGIFVGGAGRRMGGVAKGLLETPDGEPIVERLLRVSREALAEPDVVLVGNASAYASLGLTALEDDPPGVGPIGGLAALLTEAARRGVQSVLVLACDMPFVTKELVQVLSTASPGAAAVAPRHESVWEPLSARFDVARTLPVVRRLLDDDQHSVFAVLDGLGDDAVALALGDETRQALTDWDEPSDVE